MSPHRITEDGFKNQLATNYIGHFALTGQLKPLLLKTQYSRIIALSSLSFKWFEILFDDMHINQSLQQEESLWTKQMCMSYSCV